MKQASYSAALAFGLANNDRNNSWTHDVLRPCENYLYAFAGVDEYDMPRYVMYAGVHFHTASKPYRFWYGELKKIAGPLKKYLPPLGSTPPSGEAHFSGLEGAKDAGRRNWINECQEFSCD